MTRNDKFEDELNNLTTLAERTVDKDLIQLETMSASRRSRQYERLVDKQRRFETEFINEHYDKLSEFVIDDALSKFTTARLFLHVSSLEDDQAEPLAPDDFTDDEIRAALQFDQYRAFDVSDEEDLHRRIENKDEEIYQFVINEIAGQTDQRKDVLNTESNRVRKPIMRFIKDRYDERLERSQDAVGLYIQTHGLPNVISSIEEAVETAAKGAATREEVETVVSEQLEELSSRVHASVREQERAIRSDIASLKGEVVSIEAETDTEASIDTTQIETQLSELRSQIEAVRTEQADNITELEHTIEALRSERGKLDDRIDELESATEATVDAVEEASDTVAANATTVVESELERVREQRAQLNSELNRLAREREELEAASDQLETQQASLNSRVDRVTKSLNEESSDKDEADVVPAQVARLFELDFISRFEESIQTADRIILPDGDEFQPGDQFHANTNESLDERSRMRELLTNADKDPGLVEQYPLRRRSRYTIASRSRLGIVKRASLVVEAIAHNHLEAFATNGFDGRPAGLDDVLSVINEAINRADERNTPHLIAVASTTGWTDRVRELVIEEDFSRTRLGTNVSLCLVDARSGELLYDDSDKLVAANCELFERAVQDERISACAEHIKSEYLHDPMTDVVGIDIVAADGFDEHIIKSAFTQLADYDIATEKYHPDRGPYLVS